MNMNNDKIMNRKLYKEIKKFDRTQMEKYLLEIYKQGFEDGRQSVPGVDISKIKKIAMSIKGIGEKRADEIICKINEAFKE